MQVHIEDLDDLIAWMEVGYDPETYSEHGAPIVAGCVENPEESSTFVEFSADVLCHLKTDRMKFQEELYQRKTKEEKLAWLKSLRNKAVMSPRCAMCETFSTGEVYSKNEEGDPIKLPLCERHYVQHMKLMEEQVYISKVTTSRFHINYHRVTDKKPEEGQEKLSVMYKRARTSNYVSYKDGKFWEADEELKGVWKWSDEMMGSYSEPTDTEKEAEAIIKSLEKFVSEDGWRSKGRAAAVMGVIQYMPAPKKDKVIRVGHIYVTWHKGSIAQIADQYSEMFWSKEDGWGEV